MQGFAYEEGFGGFRADQRAAVTISDFHFAEELRRTDARLRFVADGIVKLRGVGGDGFPFAGEVIRNVYEERWRNGAWEKKISYSIRTPAREAVIGVVFGQAGDVRGFADELRRVRVVWMRIVPELCEDDARAQATQSANDLHTCIFIHPKMRIAEVEIFADGDA